MAKSKRFKILIDVHEMESQLHTNLIGLLDKSEVDIKGGKKCDTDPNYDPCADYIIQDVNGNTWGIERKSFMDCYQSILSGRIYGQLAELQGKYPNHAILLLEAPSYFPVKLRKRKYQIIKAVYTFFDERSMSMPCWIVSNPKHGADLIIKLAKGQLHLDLTGRGFKVIVDD